MPRPKLPPGRAATALIGIRLTRERKRAYAKAARREKLTLTEWILKAADFHLQGKGHFTTHDLDLVRKKLSQLPQVVTK